MSIGSEVKQIRRVQIIDPKKIPNGVYPASWSGYIVKASIGKVTYELQTTNGVRGLDVPCQITVQDGSVHVNTKE